MRLYLRWVGSRSQVDGVRVCRVAEEVCVVLIQDCVV